MRLVASLAAVVVVAGAAHGQDFLDDLFEPDLAGTWNGASGQLVIAGDEVYSVSGPGFTGTGTLEGSVFTVTRTVTTGVVGALAGNGSSHVETVAFSFSRGKAYDWLSRPGEVFYRPRRSDKKSDNGPWTKPEKEPVLDSERIGGLYDDLQDVLGNKNFVVDDPRDPSLDDAGKLAKVLDFVKEKEADWGEPTTTLAAKDFPNEGIFDGFRAQKALYLARYGRKPSEVEDTFLEVSGSVEGAPINPRKIMVQRWKAIGKDAKAIGAVFPGYRDSGPIFLEQVQLANKAGADMVTMDAQWSGYTEGGHAGGVDSGQGIARDTYAVAAYVGKTYGKKLFVMGSSLGGGPGTIGMLTFARTHSIDVRVVSSSGKVLEGNDLVPASTPAIAQAPFLEMTPSLGNEFDRFLAHVPILRTHEFHTERNEKPTDREHIVKNLITREEASPSEAEAMIATFRFNDEVVERVKHGLGPQGPLYVIHAKNDTLAHYPMASAVVDALKAQGVDAELTTLDSDNHMIWLDLSQQRAFLPYLAKILN